MIFLNVNLKRLVLKIIQYVHLLLCSRCKNSTFISTANYCIIKNVFDRNTTPLDISYYDLFSLQGSRLLLC